MVHRWKEITRLRFKGKRFDDHALDAAALTDVQRFLRIVEETAKALWRADNPDRERLPAGFETDHRAYLRKIATGSAVAVIEAKIEISNQSQFLDRDAEKLEDAADLTCQTFEALEKNRPLPARLPKSLVSEYAEIGTSLNIGESLEITTANQKRSAKYLPEFRDRWGMFALQPYEAAMTQVGEIVEADVRNKRFQVWTKQGAALQAPFKPEQEQFVTGALKDHESITVRVSGIVEFSSDGKALRFLDVKRLEVVPPQSLLFDPDAPSIEEEIEAIWKDVTESEWAKLPADLSENLDHYLYGLPKR